MQRNLACYTVPSSDKSVNTNSVPWWTAILIAAFIGRNRARLTHSDCGVHTSCGQAMDASIRAVLEVQAVNRFPVVPCNLARHHLHVVYLTRPRERERLNLMLQTDWNNLTLTQKRTQNDIDICFKYGPCFMKNKTGWQSSYWAAGLIKTASFNIDRLAPLAAHLPGFVGMIWNKVVEKHI